MSKNTQNKGGARHHRAIKLFSFNSILTMSNNRQTKLINTPLFCRIRAERVIIVHELPLRHTAIDAADEDWGSDGALLRMLSSDAELSRCAAVAGLSIECVLYRMCSV